ncbi:MAG: metal-dependent hydrolase [Spirochaetes bacterium]|nr:metal-dependent hydrolase [Spirochaetota bacterium]
MTKTDQKIKVRRINFGHESEEKRHYFRDNPIMTHFMNSLHTVFPDGERLFIRSVKYFDKEIQNPELKERVKAFIGQEMQHGMQHERFLQALDKMGLESTAFEEWYAKNAYVSKEDKMSAERLLLTPIAKLFGEKAGERMALSATAALEHYTATLGEVVLKGEDYYMEGMPENLKQLFLWHAAEEVEHKSVAFDVFQEVAKGNYAERQLGFAFASFFLAYYIGIGWVHYLTHDKELTLEQLVKAVPPAIPVYFNLLKDVIGGALEYLKPGFHPDQMDNDELARSFFERYGSEFQAKSA